MTHASTTLIPKGSGQGCGRLLFRWRVMDEQEISPHHQKPPTSKYSPKQRLRIDVGRAFQATDPPAAKPAASIFVKSRPARDYRAIGFGQRGTGNPTGRPSKAADREGEARMLVRQRERAWKSLARPESIKPTEWGLLKSRMVDRMEAPDIVARFGGHGKAAVEAMRKRLQRARAEAEAAIPGFGVLFS